MDRLCKKYSQKVDVHIAGVQKFLCARHFSPAIFKYCLRNHLNGHAIPNMFPNEQPVLLDTDPKASLNEPAHRRQCLNADK